MVEVPELVVLEVIQNNQPDIAGRFIGAYFTLDEFVGVYFGELVGCLAVLAASRIHTESTVFRR